MYLLKISIYGVLGMTMILALFVFSGYLFEQFPLVFVTGVIILIVIPIILLVGYTVDLWIKDWRN